MKNTVWGLFVSDGQRGFPNFFPIGVFSSKDLAEKELLNLPKEEHYQLFELPINDFFGAIKDNKVVSAMGELYHEHFTSDDEEQFEF